MLSSELGVPMASAWRQWRACAQAVLAELRVCWAPSIQARVQVLTAHTGAVKSKVTAGRNHDGEHLETSLG